MEQEIILHKYSDKELTSRIVTLANHLSSDVKRVNSVKDDRVIRFRINYCNESFLADLNQVNSDIGMPFFIRDGYLCVYKSRIT